MVVIGFFKNLFTSLSGLVTFVSQPLSEVGVTVDPFKDMSIMSLLGVGLVGTLGVLLSVHLVRLFIGG